MISKWGKARSLIFLYPDGDPDQSQNLMGYKFEQDPSSYFYEDSTMQ